MLIYKNMRNGNWVEIQFLFREEALVQESISDCQGQGKTCAVACSALVSTVNAFWGADIPDILLLQEGGCLAQCELGERLGTISFFREHGDADLQLFKTQNIRKHMHTRCACIV